MGSGHCRFPKPPHVGPSRIAQIPGQSAAMSQPGLVGLLMHVLPVGQGASPRLPHAVGVEAGPWFGVAISLSHVSCAGGGFGS